METGSGMKNEHFQQLLSIGMYNLDIMLRFS